MDRAPALGANVALAALVVASSVGLVEYRELGDATRVVIALIAFGAFGALFLPSLRPYALTPGRVMLASAVMVGIAVAAPLATSHDLWSYVSYGRIISVHHASPFTSVPADFVHDPFLHLVGRGWRHTGSVYGPGFVGVAALGTALTGPSVLANRLLFQGLEAVALAIALGIIWRQKRDPAAVAFLGLNPAVIAVVNGGHNDVLVGLALLSGTLMLVERRPHRGGVALALGALVKLVLILPIAALLVWVWRRHGAGAAARAGAACSIVIVGGYAIAGGTSALEPLLRARGQRSRASIWQLPTRLLLGPAGIHGSGAASTIGTLALLTVAIVAILLVLTSARDWSIASPTSQASAAAIAGAMVVIFLLAAAYVLPWYSVWGLPVLALVWRSRIALVASVQSALVAFAYLVPHPINGMFLVYASGMVPVVSVGLLVYVITFARRRRLAEAFSAPVPVGEFAVR